MNRRFRTWILVLSSLLVFLVAVVITGNVIHHQHPSAPPMRPTPVSAPITSSQQADTHQRAQQWDEEVNQANSNLPTHPPVTKTTPSVPSHTVYDGPTKTSKSTNKKTGVTTTWTCTYNKQLTAKQCVKG